MSAITWAAMNVTEAVDSPSAMFPPQCTTRTASTCSLSFHVQVILHSPWPEVVVNCRVRGNLFKVFFQLDNGLPLWQWFMIDFSPIVFCFFPSNDSHKSDFRNSLFSPSPYKHAAACSRRTLAAHSRRTCSLAHLLILTEKLFELWWQKTTYCVPKRKKKSVV